MSDAPAAPWSAEEGSPVDPVIEPEFQQVDEQVQQVDEQNEEDEQVDEQDTAPALDLDRVERDLADVELALARLDAGTYWTDEVTGGAIPDELLAEQPTARRAVGR